MIANGLFDLLDAAELCPRRAVRFGCGHACCDSLVNQHLHVCMYFLVKLMFDLPFSEEVSQHARDP
jgi:hypothetical protein